MPPKNIRRPTAEYRAAVCIHGAKPSWQRRQTRLTFGGKIGNSICGFRAKRNPAKRPGFFCSVYKVTDGYTSRD
jgi:hypothetical protein